MLSWLFTCSISYSASQVPNPQLLPSIITSFYKKNLFLIYIRGVLKIQFVSKLNTLAIERQFDIAWEFCIDFIVIELMGKVCQQRLFGF